MSTNYNYCPTDDRESLLRHHQNDVPLINVGFSDFPSQPRADRQQIVDVRVETVKSFTWSHFVMSLIIFIVGGCICMIPLVWPFSILGLVYSSNAYSSHGEKAYGRSEHQNKLAKIFWIFAAVFMLIGVIIIVCLFVYVKTVVWGSINDNNSINNINQNIDFNHIG